jgi:Flp pilus assembly pilin Flp
MSNMRRFRRTRKGQALVEYAILIGAVSIVCLTAASLLGHKAGDLLGYAAALLPGDDGDDQGPIFVSKLAATAQNGTGNAITLAGTPGNALFLFGYQTADGTPVAGAGTPPPGMAAPNVTAGLVFDEPDGT